MGLHRVYVLPLHIRRPQGLVRARGRAEGGAIHRSLHLGLRDEHKAAQVEQLGTDHRMLSQFLNLQCTGSVEMFVIVRLVVTLLKSSIRG